MRRILSMKVEYQNQYCQRIFRPTIAKLFFAIGVIFISFYPMSRLINAYEFKYPVETPSHSTGILTILNDVFVDHFQYDQHIASLTCYAHHHAYQFTLVHPQQYPKCTNMTQSVYFQKHCFVLMYLLDHSNIQWLLVLDSDVLVVNLSRKIESYLPDSISKSSIHMIFYNRINGEIAAGNYLVHNHPWSHKFLLDWVQYEHRINHIKLHNNDNGALHMHLLDKIVSGTSQSLYDHCFRVYERSNDSLSYNTYVGCCICALGGRWSFKHLHIFPRLHSFIRDNLGYNMSKRILSPTDFLIHGHKRNVSVYYFKEINTYQCVHSKWILPISENIIMTNFTEVKETIRTFDQEAAKMYPFSVGIPDISDCWPNCTENKIRRQMFMEKVCHGNASWRLY